MWKRSALLGPPQVWCPARPGMEARELGKPSPQCLWLTAERPELVQRPGGRGGRAGRRPLPPCLAAQAAPPGKDEWPPDAARGFREHEDASEDVASQSYSHGPTCSRGSRPATVTSQGPTMGSTAGGPAPHPGEAGL